MKIMYKTTGKHFELYKKECRRFLSSLSLTGWELSFEHKKLNGNYAEGNFGEASRTFHLVLGSEWETKPTNKVVIDTARHEILHALLRPLVEKCLDVYNYNFIIEPIEHAIIHKIQGFIK